VSPILVRPVREQLEHDRMIRLLQLKFKRRYEAGMNPGNEQNAPVGVGPSALYPDLVLMAQNRGRKVEVVIEIETGESVNHLEALAQWAHFARIRAPFHLYVPAGMVDVARRLCEDNQIHVAEIWSYHMLGDQPRFALVHRSKEAAPRPKAVARPAAVAPARKPAPRPAKPAAKPAKKKAASKPAKKTARKKR
jgi:hypothetical protein